MTRTVAITHIYPVEYVPRGGRANKKAAVREAFPVAIRELAAREAPVALRMERVVKPYPMFADAPETVPERWLRVGDGLARRLAGEDGGPRGVEALTGVNPQAPGRDWDRFGYPYQSVPHEPRVVDDIALLDPRKVVSDGAARSRANLAEAAGRTALVDGELHVPGSEPVWGVRSAHGCGIVQIAACLRSDFDLGTTDAMFRADQLDRAVAYAEEVVAELRLGEPEKTFGIQVVGSIEVLDPGALHFDAGAFNADRLVRNAYRHPGTEGFARLPIPALRAWVDFREAAAGMEAGRAGALDEAVQALARVKAALPETQPRAARDKYATAAPDLARMLTGAAALARFSAEDRPRAELDADMEALSACVA